MTRNIGRLGTTATRLNRSKPSKRKPATVKIVLNNNDKFLKELTSATCDNRATNFLMVVHKLSRGTDGKTTLVIRTTKG